MKISSTNLFEWFSGIIRSLSYFSSIPNRVQRLYTCIDRTPPNLQPYMSGHIAHHLGRIAPHLGRIARHLPRYSLPINARLPLPPAFQSLRRTYNQYKLTAKLQPKQQKAVAAGLSQDKLGSQLWQTAAPFSLSAVNKSMSSPRYIDKILPVFTTPGRLPFSQRPITAALRSSCQPIKCAVPSPRTLFILSSHQ